MSNLQRFRDGDDAQLITSVEDAFGTMALLDAYISSCHSVAIPVQRDD